LHTKLSVDKHFLYMQFIKSCTESCHVMSRAGGPGTHVSRVQGRQAVFWGKADGQPGQMLETQLC